MFLRVVGQGFLPKPVGPAGGMRYYKENRVLNRDNRSGPIAEIEFGWSPTPFAFSYFPKELLPLPLE